MVVLLFFLRENKWIEKKSSKSLYKSLFKRNYDLSMCFYRMISKTAQPIWFDKAFQRSREKFKVFWANDLEARGDVEKRGTQLNL